jgi:hypothetical protein
MTRFLCVVALFIPLTLLAAEPARPAYKVLAADNSTGKVAIVNESGDIEWEFANKHTVHDLHMLPGGNILTHTSNTTVVEINPKKEIVWKYEAKPKDGYKGRVEVHAFQRLDDGNTMIAESGNCRIIEVDPEGKITKEIPLKVEKSHPHTDTRMVRKLANGNYLVCHESEGAVKEYDPSAKVVWEYKLDLNNRKPSDGHGPEGHGVAVYGAVRLENGNTLIAGGNNNRVLEVTKEGKIVWQLDQNDLPEITFAWVTTLQVLPNGNIIIGNCHATEKNPQLIEVTREKKVVWTFRDFKIFGNNLASAQVLGITGAVIR